MRDQPSMLDPYRTLGLQPGAPMSEVKKAYRRLAKAYHPDSAGEAALPRFLAIHEAYEAIRTGRPIPAVRGAGAAAAARSASEPWRADPDRARAAREQARRRAGARPGGGATAGAAGGAGTSASGASRRGSARPGAAGSTTSSGSTGGGGRTGASSSAGRGGATGTSGGSGRRRNTRKATMGSTSYDEARDPNDATWSGASWYGPSTGEYWIINPREYADPRKHGPEYQSRARRMAEAASDAPAEPDAPLGPPQPEMADEGDAELRGAAEHGSAEGASARPAGGLASGTSSGSAPGRSRPDGWTFDRSSGARTRATPVEPARPRETWTPSWPSGSRSMRRNRRLRNGGLSPRELVGTASDDPVRRFGIALIAWPPIGLAAAAFIGDLTGCAVYSADCGGTEPLLPWLAQAVILGLLLLLPAVARVLAGGAIAILAALVPLTFFLVAIGGTGAAQAGFALAFLLGIAWLAGVAWGLTEVRRRSRPRTHARPGASA